MIDIGMMGMGDCEISNVAVVNDMVEWIYIPLGIANSIYNLY